MYTIARIKLTILILLLSAFFQMSKGQLIINELMSSNAGSYIDPATTEFHDWVEIYNADDNRVNIGNYYLSDDSANLLQWRLPFKYLYSGEYFIVWCEDFELENHAGFGLDNDGETIYLTYYDGEIIDRISYGPQFTDISYGRIPGQDNTWGYCAEPTPGAENNIANGYQRVAKPEFPPISGQMNRSFTLSMSSPNSGSSIHYTLDATQPDKESTEYDGELNIYETTTVRAKTYLDGYLPSADVAKTVFIDEPLFTVPIVSLTINPDYLYDDQIGIYVKGNNGVAKFCVEEPHNWNMDWERPAYLEYFSNEGEPLLSQSVGVKISGGCSRMAEIKSMSVYARGKYGDNDFDFPFFVEKPNQLTYRSFFLRNSGNDFNHSMLRDAFMQNLVNQTMDLDYQAYQPVRFYMNGEYRGLVNIREKVDEDYFFSNYGLEDDSIDFLEGNAWVIRGSNEDYNELMSFIENNDMTSPDNYQHVLNEMDMREYINYVVFQIYVKNDDWPGNNIKFWREKNGGKWRWIVYDTDFGFGIWGSSYVHETLNYATEANGPGWPNPPWSTKLFRNLIVNQEFRDEFIQTMMVHLNSSFMPDRADGILDSLSNRISEEMKLMKNKYWGDYQGWLQEIEDMKSWGKNRHIYMQQHLEDFFDLSGKEQFAISIKDIPLGQGTVSVNGGRMTEKNFSMQTYADLPYTIKALPNPGYEFSHWNTADIILEENLISQGDSWKYLDSVMAYPQGWTDTSFVDTSWMEGPAQLGYGDGDETTLLDYGLDANNKRTTYLFRKTINIENPELYKNLLLEVLVDDGAVLYINGKEYTRIYMNTGTVTPQTFASRATDMENSFHQFNPQSSWFVDGENTIAVEVHQISYTSSDISFDMKLQGTKLIASSGEVYSSEALQEGIVKEHLAITPVFIKKAVVKDIIINEISLADQNLLDDWDEPSDFIELYNQGTDTVSLEGLLFTDDALLMNKHQFPESSNNTLSIPPQEYLVLFADNQPEQGVKHVSFKLDKDGESLILSQQFGNEYTIIDSLSFSFLEKGYSYGLRINGEEFIYMSEPTPGGMNDEASEVKVVSTEYTLANNLTRVYPNPTRNRVFLDLSNWTEKGSIEIVLSNMQGQVLKRMISSGKELKEINLDKFVPGIYLLKVGNHNYQEIHRIIRTN